MKTCEEITMDIERGRYEKLSVKELVTIKMHLLMCKPCANFKRDSDLIEELLQKKYKQGEAKYTFSAEEKAAMKNSCRH